MNRQVPEQKGSSPIAIIGNGKVARHMVDYFELIGQPYTQWCRNESATNTSKLAHFKYKLKKIFQSKQDSLSIAVDGIDRVLVLIPDDQIESFIASNPILANKTCVHFSGSLNTTLAIGCHPLMTFSAKKYDLQTYQNIPFVVDEGVEFGALFPLFKNSVHTIKAEHKALYHAYCVMAGNFSQMLWKTISSEMSGIGLPAGIMSQYLQQNTQNFINDPENSITGPLVRGDAQTVKKHQHALHNQPLGDIYQAFVAMHHGQIEQQHRKSS